MCVRKHHYQHSTNFDLRARLIMYWNVVLTCIELISPVVLTNWSKQNHAPKYLDCLYLCVVRFIEEQPKVTANDYLLINWIPCCMFITESIMCQILKPTVAWPGQSTHEWPQFILHLKSIMSKDKYKRWVHCDLIVWTFGSCSTVTVLWVW